MDNFLKRFSNLRVKAKLTLLIGVFIISITVLGTVVNFLYKTSQTLTIYTSEQKLFLRTISDGIENFYAHELSGNNSDLQQSLNYFKIAYDIVYNYAIIDSLMHNMSRDEWMPYLYEIYKEGVSFDIENIKLMGEQTKVLEVLQPKQIKEIQNIALDASVQITNIISLINMYSVDKTPDKFLEIQSEFHSFKKTDDLFSNKIHTLNEFLAHILFPLIIAFIVLLGAFASFVSIKISNSITVPLNKLTENFKQIARGNLQTSVNISTKNEIGDLSNAFLKIQVGLQDIISYSKKVATGDYSAHLEPKSEDDELILTLNSMAAKLEEIKIKSEREHWIQEGINELDKQMAGNLTVRELSKNILTSLSKILNYEIGAVYSFDEVLNQFELTGSVGLNLEEVQKFVKPGEGLIGKTGLQKTFQVLDTKNKYHKIYSATGEIVPENIYLLPVLFNDSTRAVIELASVNELSERKIEFLNAVAERIAVNINAAIARFRHNELLDKTLDQAEKLKKREEELNKKLEEINAMQDKLIQEKALLDSMLKTIPDYVYFKDPDSKFLRISESMVKLFGVDSTEKIIGKSDFDFHTPSDANKFYNEEQTIIKEEKGFVDSIREGVDENNDTLWTSVTKLPIFDETGKCIGTFGISKNVTAIKKLETEVHEQNIKLLSNQNELEHTIGMLQYIQSELEREKNLMDSLLKYLPDTVYFKDLESKFIKVSSSMPKFFGLEKPEEMYGKTDFDFHTKEHAEKAFNNEQEIIKTKKPVIGSFEKVTNKDGSIRYVSSTKMPFFNEQGEVAGTFGISTDVTKIKQLELEIKERNEKLQEKQDELTVAYNELHLQQEELKTTNEELKAQEEELRVANEELAEQTKILAESEKNLQVQQEELRVTNEELELKTNQLEIQKKDITEKNTNLEKIQLDLEQKAKELELASQYKSEFLANMSHELRTPLNSLLILSKLLGNNKEGNLNEGQVKSANIIYKSGKDLLELINEILDLSKIEAGKMDFDFKTFAVEYIKTEIENGFIHVAENKGLSFEINLSEDFPKQIYSDKQRLHQIIKNILSNAFKFTIAGGIKVNFGLPDENTKIKNPQLNSKNSYLISVEDTGVGIPKDKAEAIFEAFKQADGSISRKFGGTGLGLSISKELIRVLGGEIQVESTENVGSVFTLILPNDKNLVGHAETKKQEKASDIINTEVKETTVNEESEEVTIAPEPTDLPRFIDDDRDSILQRTLVLIIHPDEVKAKELVFQCHKRNFNAVVAQNITDGIILAEKFAPKAIIISAELNATKEYELLKHNVNTSRLPIHHVSRIEDNTLNELEELETPSSEANVTVSADLEKKLGSEFNQVLIVEDDPATQEALHQLFRNKDIIIHVAKTGKQAFEMISTKTFDCVILDLGLPDMSGKELLQKLQTNKVSIPKIIIHTARELSKTEVRELNKFSESIIIKGIKSDERLMDEVSLFLHQVAGTLSKNTTENAIEYDKSSGFKGKKILLVDDDIRNVFAMAQILEEKGIEILEAENGEIAIEVLKNNPDIDLVLMDIMMPVMNGYDAMKIIRQMPEINKIPIITLTAKAMKEDYQKAINCGANDYISKPLDVEKLFELLKIWLFV